MTALGPAPHHDRVLIVVLVTATGDRWAFSADDLLEPIPAHVREILTRGLVWPEGHEGTPEAPAADECVQPVCTTGREYEYEPSHDATSPTPAAFRTGLNRPPFVQPLSPLRGWTDADERSYQEMHARALADRCNAFWKAETHTRLKARIRAALRDEGAKWHDRQLLIERLGPLPEPIPEEGL